MSRHFGRITESPRSINVPGLSVVELVMEIEETFGLAITDDEAERIHGIGGIKEFLISRVHRGSSTECVTQRAFYRLRTVVCEVLAVPRAAVNPRKRWSDLLPATRRRWAWKLIVTGAHLPNRPRWNVPILRWNPPVFRRTVGLTARLLAAMEPIPVKGPGEGWSRDEISRTVDRLVVERCEITDFCDDVFLAD